LVFTSRITYYYTGSPYNRIYQNQTPNNEKLNREEIKYQLSFKVPVWKNILNEPSTLYFAYSQLSYWQAYNQEAFFRSTDYEPELFLANELNFKIYKDFALNFFNIGAEHQSNGFGNSLERSWNRIYLEGVASNGNFMMSVKPWCIIHDYSWRAHNPDIGSYLGYMQLLFAYKYEKCVVNFRTYGLGVHGGRHTSGELDLSFPLTDYLNGYFQVFSGYGQSLIEYNHRTNSAGIGIALSNWI
jgi:phospholipase A1